MVQCSAPNCNYSSSNGYLLKRFPRDPQRRAQWVKNMQKPNWVPTDNCYVCEAHFEDHQWESQRPDRLKWNAVPTIFHTRYKYTKRRQDQSMTNTPLTIQPNISYSLQQQQSAEQIVYVLDIDDYLEGAKKDSLDIKMKTGDDVKDVEAFEFSHEMQENSKKDEIIADLRRQIAEKDKCLLKYEKIICQMNSHLEKLKGRLKFWRDFSERDKISLRKVKKMSHQSFTV